MQNEYAHILKCIHSTLAYTKKNVFIEIKRWVCYFISDRVEHIKFQQQLYSLSLFGVSQLHTWAAQMECVVKIICIHYMCAFVCVNGMKMACMPCVHTKLNWKVRAATQIALFVFPPLFVRRSISRPNWVTILFNNLFFFPRPRLSYIFMSCTRCNIIAHRLSCRFLWHAKTFFLENFHFLKAKIFWISISIINEVTFN